MNNCNLAAGTLPPFRALPPTDSGEVGCRPAESGCSTFHISVLLAVRVFAAMLTPSPSRA